MRKLNENSTDIQALEEEIRKLGMPYSGSEPDARYWANFRVRVMDRIEKDRTHSPWPTRLIEFLAEHVLATSISVAAACLAVAAFLAFQPGGERTPELANLSQAPAAAQPAPSAIRDAPQTIPGAQSTPAQQTDHPAEHSPAVHFAKAVPKVEKTDDLAIAEPLTSSPSEQAVSLESLSQPELEAVLSDLQSNGGEN